MENIPKGIIAFDVGVRDLSLTHNRMSLQTMRNSEVLQRQRLTVRGSIGKYHLPNQRNCAD
eukprot:7573231-Heterocapsa_arctica.AAC.1